MVYGRILILLIAIFSVQVHAYPAALTGEWEESIANESGVMYIEIVRFEDNVATGSLSIRGSSRCPDPIPFQGRVMDSSTMKIESTMKMVCGFRGKLMGQVVHDGNEQYHGEYRYKFLNFFIVARGQFRVRSK